MKNQLTKPKKVPRARFVGVRYTLDEAEKLLKKTKASKIFWEKKGKQEPNLSEYIRIKSLS